MALSRGRSPVTGLRRAPRRAAILAAGHYRPAPYRLFDSTLSRRAVPLGLMLVILGLYAVLALKHPLGGWDALALWNLRAKFVAAGHLRVPSAYPHPDYPPLVGLIVGAGWLLAGYTQLVPQVVHGCIFAALLGLVRRPWWVLVLVGVVGLQYAPQQYADTPLALTTVAAVIAAQGTRWGWMGVWLGVGLLLKNEGAVIALVYALLVGQRRVWGALLPFALLLTAYKLYVAVPSDLAAAGLLARVSDAGRYPVMARELVRETWRFGDHALLWAAGCAGLMGVRWRWSALTIAPLVVLAVYVGVYVITPHDVTWHISTSWYRLLWQVFPAMLVTVTQEAI